MDKRIQTISLPVVTFDELMATHAIEKVDLIQVDAEGFDYRILNSIDFKKHGVRLIIFEVEWLTQFELREIVGRLRNFQYQLYSCGGDYITISQ